MHGDAGRDGAARGENEPPLLGFDGIIGTIIICVTIMINMTATVGNRPRWRKRVEMLMMATDSVALCQEIY